MTPLMVLAEPIRRFFPGLSTNYQITQNADGSWKVIDLRSGSPDGTDTLSNIE